jgi:hypothetical protein
MISTRWRLRDVMFRGECRCFAIDPYPLYYQNFNERRCRGLLFFSFFLETWLERLFYHHRLHCVAAGCIFVLQAV